MVCYRHPELLTERSRSESEGLKFTDKLLPYKLNELKKPKIVFNFVKNN